MLNYNLVCLLNLCACLEVVQKVNLSCDGKRIFIRNQLNFQIFRKPLLLYTIFEIITCFVFNNCPFSIFIYLIFQHSYIINLQNITLFLNLTFLNSFQYFPSPASCALKVQFYMIFFRKMHNLIKPAVYTYLYFVPFNSKPYSFYDD